MFVKKGNSIVNLNNCVEFFVDTDRRPTIYFVCTQSGLISWIFKDNKCAKDHFEKLWKLMCAHNQHPIMYYDFTKEDYEERS